MFYSVFENEITIDELIKELQALENNYKGSKVISIGSCAGKIQNMESPFVITVINKESERKRIYLPTRRTDIGKTIVTND